MPEAVIFEYQGKVQISYFSQSKATLPVKLKNGEIKLVSWGRRLRENSIMPLGGWAPLAAIQQHKWNSFFPRAVKLPIKKFMKIDYEGTVQWHEVTKRQFIQGVLLQEEQETRVYIVTIIPERLDIYYNRWPRLLTD